MNGENCFRIGPGLESVDDFRGLEYVTYRRLPKCGSAELKRGSQVLFSYVHPQSDCIFDFRGWHETDMAGLAGVDAYPLQKPRELADAQNAINCQGTPTISVPGARQRRDTRHRKPRWH
jgi:hypothetical protein